MEMEEYDMKDEGSLSPIPYNEQDEIVEYEEDNGGGNTSVQVGNQAIDFLQEVSASADRFNQGLTMAQNVASMYGDIVSMRENTKAIQAMSAAKLAKTVAKFKVTQQAIAETFKERNSVLQQDYKVLDDAIAKGDREMIIAAMSKIGDIVTTSPLSELKELVERFDDPDDSLLDF